MYHQVSLFTQGHHKSPWLVLSPFQAQLISNYWSVLCNSVNCNLYFTVVVFTVLLYLLCTDRDSFVTTAGRFLLILEYGQGRHMGVCQWWEMFISQIAFMIDCSLQGLLKYYSSRHIPVCFLPSSSYGFEREWPSLFSYQRYYKA